MGVTQIDISYSSPGVKGRQIWGGLVPHGQIWRTGANEATTIAFSTDVQVEGKPLPAGKYALFTIPAAEKWTVVLTTPGRPVGRLRPQAGGGRAARRDRAARSAAARAHGVRHQGRDRHLRRRRAALGEGRRAVHRDRRYAAPGRGARRAGDLGGGRQAGTLSAWARWALENDTAIDQAVGWAARVVQGEGAKSYWAGSVHARLLAKAGKAAEARAEAERVLALVADDSIPEMKADAERLRGELAQWGAYYSQAGAGSVPVVNEARQ